MCKMFTSKFFKIVADLVAVVQKNKQALRRERNKVEVFEGKFRSLKFFLAPKRKQTFTCHTSNQNCYTCVRVMFWKKNLHSQKKDSVPTSSGPCTTTLLHSLPNHFVCSRHAGFCWMRTEVADNCFAVVDRFAASSLRTILVGQHSLISARGFSMALPYSEEM